MEKESKELMESQGKCRIFGTAASLASRTLGTLWARSRLPRLRSFVIDTIYWLFGLRLGLVYACSLVPKTVNGLRMCFRVVELRKIIGERI